MPSDVSVEFFTFVREGLGPKLTKRNLNMMLSETGIAGISIFNFHAQLQASGYITKTLT